MNNSSNKSSIVAQILLSAVAGALGYLLLFDKNVQVLTLCQILCGGIVAAGVVLIVSYFLSGDYKRLDRYGFAYGVMLIMLGCVGLIRMSELTASFELYAGMLSLILGVLTLQGAMQVMILKFGAWVFNLILAIISLGGAFCVLSNFTAITSLVQGFFSWVLLVSGACCIISMLVTGICILLHGRREKKRKEQKAKEGENPETGAESAPAPAPQPAPAAPAPESVPLGTYSPVSDPAPAFEPSETHHTGFTPAEDPAAVISENEKPELVFDPAESHHTDFKPE